MACLNFRKTYLREHLLMATFKLLRSICFLEHLRVDALFIKQPNYLFIWRITQKNTYLHSYFHDDKEFLLCFSSCFHYYFLRRHPSKTFLYWQNLKVLIFLKRYTFNIKHYVHKTCERFILVYIQITKLQNSKKPFLKVYWRTSFCRTFYTD